MNATEALTFLETFHLKNGAHASPEKGMCAMEAVAFLAREPHSDTPECASPVVGAFMRSWNDGLPDKDRDRLLKPYLLRLVGSRGTPEQEDQRAWMACDWLVRVQTPAWLELAGLRDHAGILRELAPLVSAGRATAAQPKIYAAGAAAWAAAWDAAGDAARAAAWDAAWDAARDAAGAALQPTVVALQKSALELLDAMLAVKPGGAGP